MVVSSHKDLTVWQKSFELAEKIYQITKALPLEEKFGLSTQMQRAAVSIPSNLAEGSSRNNRGEYLQFVGIARGSASELETDLLLAQKLYRLNVAEELQLLEEVQRMLTSLNHSLRTKL